MKTDDIRLFFNKEIKEIDEKIKRNIQLRDKFFKNKQLMEFVLNLILKSNIDNIDNLSNRKRYDSFNGIDILYIPIKAISKEELLLHKLFNEKYKYFDIATNISIDSVYIHVSYNIKINDAYLNITKKDIVHKIEKHKPGAKLLQIQKTTLANPPSAFKIFNKYNDTDITKDYFNTIYKVAENIGNNITNVELDKKVIIDFVNISSYNNKTKKNNIDFVNTLPDKLKSLDIVNMLIMYISINKLTCYNTNQPIRDFIYIFLNKMFIKSISKDLLNYDDKDMIYDEIFYDELAKKINAFDKQCKMLSEVL